ncbi:hypothetical protein GOV12_00980 [Candidatus Pacearchaeota archaeon]|nr:hypothetical protein [Candidatus Pacearchaeota archaeon]
MGNQKKGLLIAAVNLFIFLFLITYVSAGVYFSNIETVYNLGDIIEADITVSPEGEGPLVLDLVCDNMTLEVYRGGVPEMIQLPLTSLWTNGMTGECYFISEYLNEEKKSIKFKISKKLNVVLKTTSYFSKPGEMIIISGEVSKLNGLLVNEGEIEISIPILNKTDIDLGNLYSPIVNGNFSVSLNLPKNIPNGEYRIDVKAIEKMNKEISSEGIEMADLNIIQVPTILDIAIDNQRINPGDSINFKPLLLDQSGYYMDGEVSVIIKDDYENRLFEKIENAGEIIIFTTETEINSGYYSIEISTGELFTKKNFFINEKALVTFDLNNDNLVITNIGNVPYNKSVLIDISGQEFLRKLNNLLPGESKEFILSGDDGFYDIKVKDDSSELTREDVSLTGNAVGVSDMNNGITILANTPIIWIIFIIILGALILFLFRDILKKKSVAYPSKKKDDINIRQNLKPNKNKVLNLTKKPIHSSNVSRMEKKVGESKLSPIVKTNPNENLIKKNAVLNLAPRRTGNQAEQSLVTEGHKSRASIIAIKLKGEISNNSFESFEKALTHSYLKKGAILKNGKYVYIIFSPLVTKTTKNEIIAIKTAEKINNSLIHHNNKHPDKIIYGIGIGSGDIVNKIENNKLKFTSLGGLTVSVKKIADASNQGKILISGLVNEKTSAEVNTEKKMINGIEVYEVKKIANYEKNSKFINDFVKRQNNNKIIHNDKRSLITPNLREQHPIIKPVLHHRPIIKRSINPISQGHIVDHHKPVEKKSINPISQGHIVDHHKHEEKPDQITKKDSDNKTNSLNIDEVDSNSLQL